MKEPLHTLIFGVQRREQFSPLIGVAKELVDRFLERILNTRTLELNYHQGDAVHKQHSIGDDMPASAGKFNLKLIDD